MYFAMINRSLLSLIACLVLAFLMVPGLGHAFPPPEEDKAEIDRVLRELIASQASPDFGQIEEWVGPSGNNGEITFRAVMNNQGNICQSLQGCEKPCRSYTYTHFEKGSNLKRSWSGSFCLVNAVWNQRLETPSKKNTPFKTVTIKSKPEISVPDRREPALNPKPAIASVQEPETKKVQPAYNVTLLRSVQQKLRELKYYTGAIDGVSGPGTIGAMRSFATDEGLAVSFASLDDVKLDRVSKRAQLAMDRIRLSGACYAWQSEIPVVACGVRK